MWGLSLCEGRASLISMLSCARGTNEKKERRHFLSSSWPHRSLRHLSPWATLSWGRAPAWQWQSLLCGCLPGPLEDSTHGQAATSVPQAVHLRRGGPPHQGHGHVWPSPPKGSGRLQTWGCAFHIWGCFPEKLKDTPGLGVWKATLCHVGRGWPPPTLSYVIPVEAPRAFLTCRSFVLQTRAGRKPGERWAGGRMQTGQEQEEMQKQTHCPGGPSGRKVAPLSSGERNA